MTDAEWQECLERLDKFERNIMAMEPDEPSLDALRCVHSQHRTLAHLRACQESWLEACTAFQARDNPSLKMLHPWRVFDQQSYQSIPWDEHLAAFRSDRARLCGFLKTSDRKRGGKINANCHTIESLVLRIVSHERHHLFTLR